MKFQKKAIQDYCLKHWFPISVILLIIVIVLFGGCGLSERTRPCDVKYKFQDEDKKIFIELEAKNIEDCQPYMHQKIDEVELREVQ